MQRVTSLHDKGKVELNPATLGVYDTIKAGGGGGKTHSFWATKMYFSDCLLTLSSSIRRKAWLTPAVETAHVALATVSCSPKVCLGNDMPG